MAENNFLKTSAEQTEPTGEDGCKNLVFEEDSAYFKCSKSHEEIQKEIDAGVQEEEIIAGLKFTHLYSGKLL